MTAPPPGAEASPLVTVVIPIFNHEQYVAECIRSIIQQTYKQIELIVINDGSTDHSHDRVLPLTDECQARFVDFYYINRENRGLAATLNQALAMAKGVYFTVLASDDAALPEKTSVLVNAFRTAPPDCAAIFGDAVFMDEHGHNVIRGPQGALISGRDDQPAVRFIEYYIGKRQLDYRGEEFGTFQSLLEDNYLPAMSNLVKTEALREAHGWTEGNPVEDWEMWLKLSQHSRLRYVDQPVARYRWHATNSFKAMPTRYNYACWLLVKHQRRFCAAHGLLPVWRRVCRKWAQRLLYDRNLALTKRVPLIKPAGVGYVIRTKMRSLLPSGG